MTPIFVNGGRITDEGQQVVDFIEATIEKAREAGRTDVDAMNGLPGYMKHYHVNVMSFKAYEAVDWLRDHAHAANVAYGEIKRLEEADKQQNNAAADDDKTKKLAESLEELTGKLDAALKRIDELEKGKNGKKPDARKPETAPEETTAEEKPESEG